MSSSVCLLKTTESRWGLIQLHLHLTMKLLFIQQALTEFYLYLHLFWIEIAINEHDNQTYWNHENLRCGW